MRWPWGSMLRVSLGRERTVVYNDCRGGGSGENVKGILIKVPVQQCCCLFNRGLGCGVIMLYTECTRMVSVSVCSNFCAIHE